MNNINFDVGQNLTSLGFALLFLKYLLPIFLGFIILLVIAGFLYWVYRQFQNNFRDFDLDDRKTQVNVIVGLILGVVFFVFLVAVLNK